MTCFSQDGNGFDTQQWSQNSPWLTQNQPQFRLHGPSLANRNLSNFQLFHDVELEVIGSQMPPNIECSGDVTKGGKVDKTVTKGEDHIKKRKRHGINFKIERSIKKKVKNDGFELDDSEDEEKIFIKW